MKNLKKVSTRGPPAELATEPTNHKESKLKLR